MTSPWYRAALAALDDGVRRYDADLLLAFHRAAEWECALVNLGACLRDAGMLCEAFEAGDEYRYNMSLRTIPSVDTWRPGCGREMP